MQTIQGYVAGANLGHWISQYGKKGREHFDTYITERDIARMKRWGLDHVRVPVDYFLFESDDLPGVYREEGLFYVDAALSWCKKHGLNMILDLHHAPGFFFGNGERNDLFTSRASQERFLAIWRMFARRYAAEGDGLMFELLNELVWDSAEPWNALWREAKEVIHAECPHRRIIVGGNHYNNVFELNNLYVDPDDRIFYTFHMYEPFIFTHQRAPWMDFTRKYRKAVSYPFRVADHLAFFGEEIPHILAPYRVIDRTFIEDFLSAAVDFSRRTGKALYCGEYGVISYAHSASAVRWLEDIADVLTANGMGRAVWSYRGFAAITTPSGRRYNRDMVRAISRKEPRN